MRNIRISTGPAETRDAVRGLVLLAFVMVCLAVHEWFIPTLPPFKGRFSWLSEIAYSVAGQKGLVVLLLALAVALLAIARFMWRHTPNLPSEGWLWSK